MDVGSKALATGPSLKDYTFLFRYLSYCEEDVYRLLSELILDAMVL